MAEDLDQAADALLETRRQVTKVLVVCGDYVTRRADDDPEAAELARLLSAAYDDMAIAGMGAVTVIGERAIL